jgi:tetratricopeptide (TPR) repeat protein
MIAVLLVLPLLLRRRVPGLALVLFYWMVLSLIPSQVLSFIHPVTDRYLYFPSVGLAILIAWVALAAGRRLGTKGTALAGVLLALLAVAWSSKTLAYLEEWSDPRSVWFGAAAKSQDTNVYQYLGTHYQTAADSLAHQLTAGGGSRQEAYSLARAEWEDEPRLQNLLDEWSGGDFTGPATLAYQRALRERAWHEFGRAVAAKGRRVRPNLFFRRAKLQFDLGNLEAAAEEFRRAYEESRKHTFIDVRQEMAVRCHHALGIIELQRGNRAEALRMFTIARDEQLRAGKTWIPNLDGYLRRLETEAGPAGSR